MIIPRDHPRGSRDPLAFIYMDYRRRRSGHTFVKFVPFFKIDLNNVLSVPFELVAPPAWPAGRVRLPPASGAGRRPWLVPINRST